MVDLERREVVDVLPDRSARTTGQWLGQHPRVEIVSRDRCGLYAEGARQGAPQAQQVADRFHLLQNLRQTIEQQLSRAPRPTKQPSPAITEAEPAVVAGWIGHGRQPALVEHRQLVSTGRRAVFMDMFDRVKALQLAGHSVTAIVRQTRFNWRTVVKWVRLDALPERNVMAPKPNTPSGFTTILPDAGPRAARPGGPCCWRSETLATRAACLIWADCWRVGAVPAALSPLTPPRLQRRS
jgi:hypothetical protein